MVHFCIAARDGFIRDELREQLAQLDPTSILCPVTGSPNVAESWNRAARNAISHGATTLAFLHDDVDVLANAWAFKRVKEALKGDDTGIVGVCGSILINGSGSWWGSGETLHVCRGMIGGPDGWMAWNGFGDAIAVDGVFMAMRVGAYKHLGGFDEELDGPHFYDVDMSIRAHLAGYRNRIVKLPIDHKSKGNYGMEWERLRRVFVEKHHAVLPVSLGPCLK